jgi:hypothetical protein
MSTYEITERWPARSVKQRIVRAVFMGAVIAIAHLFVDLISPRRPFTSSLEHALMMGAVFGVLYTRLFQRRFVRVCQVQVEEDHISATYFFGSKVFHVTHTVPWSKIKLVREMKPNFVRPTGGLVVSRFGPLGTRMWGCVWIPKALPQYDELKSLVLNLQARTSA